MTLNSIHSVFSKACFYTVVDGRSDGGFALNSRSAFSLLRNHAHKGKVGFKCKDGNQ